MLKEGAPDSFEVDFDADVLFVNVAVTLLLATMEALVELQVFNLLYSIYLHYIKIHIQCTL